MEKRAHFRSWAALAVLVLLLATVAAYFIAPLFADAKIREELGDPDAFVTDTARSPWAYVSEDGVFSICHDKCYGVRILRVPESVNGVTVTSLGKFFEKPFLQVERLILPGTVKNPDIYYRLSEWKSLKEVVFREGVEDVSRVQLMCLDSLEAVYIPASVTKIGNVFLYSGNGNPVIYYGGTQAQWDALDMGADRLEDKYTVVFETTVPPEWIEQTK